MAAQPKTKASGLVYALTNEAMPGIVKIGHSKRTPEDRLREINGYLGSVIDLPAFEMPFYAVTKASKSAEATLHRHFQHVRWERGSLREFFVVDLTTVRQAFETLVGPVTEFTTWPWPRPRNNEGLIPVPQWKGGRFRGGFDIYRWFRINYDEMIARLNQPDFSWPRIAYEIGVTVARPGQTFRPLPPDVVQKIWNKARSSHEMFGPCDFSTRKEGGWW